ncbi:MAG: UPF0158 family protein [Lactimicrobium sp.]|jgi:hypothetical protein|uniref:UPF0158 family protein n=1 Tax=Lactimicrobium sp. TaxID=2563780 RepID=UPI002F35EAE0
MKVKLSDIVDAIEMMDRYSEYFLDLETGKIEWVSDMTMTSAEKEEVYDRLDEHGFCRLPSSFDINEYDIMESFIDTLSGAVRDKLSSAICGRGAFGRFKDDIRRMGIEQEWYDYQEAVYKRKAACWCEENEIEYEE